MKIFFTEFNEFKGVKTPVRMTDKCEYEPVDTRDGKKKIDKMEEEEEEWCIL